MRLQPFANFINNCNPYGQEITVYSHRWINLLTQEQRNGLGYDFNHNFTITRDEIRLEDNRIHKIIKVLMWGYNRGGRGNNVLNILHNINNVEHILNNAVDNGLTEETFNDLKNIDGMGLSTMSKLFFFFDINVLGRSSLIIDSNVLESMSLFDDFITCPKKVDSYYEYNAVVFKMHRLTQSLRIDSSEKLEYFLFNLASDVKQLKRNLQDHILLRVPF